MALRTPSKPEEDREYRPPEWRPQSPSAEELERIPTASQEGVDHLRSQHKGASPTYKPDGRGGYDDQKADQGFNPAASRVGQQKKLSPQDISSREGGSASHKQSGVDAEKSALGVGSGGQDAGWKTSEENDSRFQKFKGRVTKKRAAVATVVGGGVVTGGIFGIGILQGPIYSAMLSNGLQKNFYKSEQTYVKRTSNSFAIHKKGDPGSTRVGRLGQYVFDVTERDLKRQGVTMDRNARSGAPRAVQIETDKNDLTKGQSREEARRTIARTLGVNESQVKFAGGAFGNDGQGFKFWVRVEDYDPKRIRDLDKKLVSTLNRGPIIAAMQTRVLNKFTNSTRSVFNYYENKRAVKSDGIDAERTAQREERTARQKARERQEENRNRLKQRLDSARSNLRDKASGSAGKAVLGTIAATEAVCLTKALSEIIPAFNQTARMVASTDAAGVIASGSATQSFINLDIEEMGGERESHIDEKGDDLTSGKAMSATLGDADPKGPDIDPRQKAVFTGESSWEEINKFISQVPAVDAVCSPVGQALTGAVGVLTLALGPGGWAVTAGKAIAGSAASVVALNLARSLIEPDSDVIQKNLAGAAGSNWVAHGGRTLSNITAIPTGGVVLSDEESKSVDDAIITQSREEFAKKSIATRLFDVTDYRSLAAITARKSNFFNNTGSVTKMATKTFNPANGLGSFASTFTPKAMAQDGSSYDWGYNRIGIPEAMLDKEEYKDYQKNAEDSNKAVMLNSDLIEKAKKCHGVSFDESQRGWNPENDVDIYGQDYMQADCNSKDETWQRIQLWILDDDIFTQSACDKGLDEACAARGHSTKTTASSTSSAPTGEGAEAIIQVLENEFKKNGNKVLETCGSNCGPEVKKYTGGPQGPSAPWCAWFVSWVYREAGYEFKGAPAGADGNIPAVVNLVAWFKKYGIHFTKDSTEHKPQPGDVVMYGGSVHTGIVYKVDGDMVETIEGNTSSDNNFDANGGTVAKKKFNYKTYSSRSLEFGRLKGL